jgi:hypothetical protein
MWESAANVLLSANLEEVSVKVNNPVETKDQLRGVAYAGDIKILLAMSMKDAKINETDNNVAGFAIWRTVAGKEQILANRIAVRPSRVGANTGPKWTNSDEAPFQKFRWVDVPPDALHDREPETSMFRATPRAFRSRGSLPHGKSLAEPRACIRAESVLAADECCNISSGSANHEPASLLVEIRYTPYFHETLHLLVSDMAPA